MAGPPNWTTLRHFVSRAAQLVALPEFIAFAPGHATTKPTCNAAMRDALMATRGGAGVIDRLHVCRKNASDAYAWTEWVDRAGDTMTGGLTSTSATAGVGYATGAGGTVTQATNKSTGVTLNKICGQITLASDNVGNGASRTFTVTNSAVASTDGALVWVASGGTVGAYELWVSAVGAGSFSITLRNISGGALNETPVLGFAVLKSVAA